MVQRVCDRCKKAIDSKGSCFKLTSVGENFYGGLVSTDKYDLCVDCHIAFTSQFLEGK